PFEQKHADASLLASLEEMPQLARFRQIVEQLPAQLLLNGKQLAVPWAVRRRAGAGAGMEQSVEAVISAELPQAFARRVVGGSRPRKRGALQPLAGPIKPDRVLRIAACAPSRHAEFSLQPSGSRPLCPRPRATPARRGGWTAGSAA